MIRFVRSIFKRNLQNKNPIRFNFYSSTFPKSFSTQIDDALQLGALQSFLRRWPRLSKVQTFYTPIVDFTSFIYISFEYSATDANKMSFYTFRYSPIVTVNQIFTVSKRCIANWRWSKSRKSCMAENTNNCFTIYHSLCIVRSVCTYVCIHSGLSIHINHFRM